MPVRRGGNAEGAGLGNRFAQQVDQRLVDARVLDPSGSEKKFDAASRSHGVGVVPTQTRRTGTNHRSSSPSRDTRATGSRRGR